MCANGISFIWFDSTATITTTFLFGDLAADAQHKHTQTQATIWRRRRRRRFWLDITLSQYSTSSIRDAACHALSHSSSCIPISDIMRAHHLIMVHKLHQPSYFSFERSRLFMFPSAISVAFLRFFISWHLWAPTSPTNARPAHNEHCDENEIWQKRHQRNTHRRWTPRKRPNWNLYLKSISLSTDMSQ